MRKFVAGDEVVYKGGLWIVAGMISSTMVKIRRGDSIRTVKVTDVRGVDDE